MLNILWDHFYKCLVSLNYDQADVYVALLGIYVFGYHIFSYHIHLGNRNDTWGFFFFLEFHISFSFATGESTGHLMIVHNTAHVFCTNTRVNSRKCCHTTKSHQNRLPKFCVFNTDIKGVM